MAQYMSLVFRRSFYLLNYAKLPVNERCIHNEGAWVVGKFRCGGQVNWVGFFYGNSF